MFSTFPKPNFNFSFTFILLSANAFNLEQSKTLLFGKELRDVQIQSICRRQININSKFETCFGMVRKHCGKRRKCWLKAFFCFSHKVFKSFPSLGCLKSGLCGKGLTLYHTILTFKDPQKEGCGIHI